jgi:hypothetical protein
LVIDQIEREALDIIRATDPEAAKQFLRVLDLLAENPNYKNSSIEELTEAVKDLVFYSGVLYQEKQNGIESIGNIIMRL